MIKQTNPLEDRENYQDRHEKSLIALLVPQHIEYTRRVLDEANRRQDVLVPVEETLRLVR